MKRKSGLSGISSGKSSETLTDDFTIYDVPGANLDARAEAYTLLKHPDETVQASAQKIIDLLSRSIRAMGREDVGLLVKVEDNKEEVA
jgi:hypothetical protein